ncbi:hypothetical protein HMPREF9455_03625 [Dysgonomonas gadei ATCC BAA-286]|uniref:Uncharacterized protein n=1 Tax=Dysgonomonas gadei ATCC BAA-286 TaxID=742766 RepID=F5J2Q8_9BACT|nr:hypothetical protein HMPREF9455_03625 [Dysgonomonas gadei ATCC BAA-286]
MKINEGVSINFDYAESRKTTNVIERLFIALFLLTKYYIPSPYI